MTAPDPFPQIRFGGEEMRTSLAYHYHNRERETSPTLVIQRTLTGAGYFQDHLGRHLVRPGFAMLFTHDEDTAYGYPPEATEPYRLSYVAFTPGGVQPLFARLRADYGSVIPMAEGAESTTLFDELQQRYLKRRFRDRLQESDLIYRLLIALYREQVQGTRQSDPIEFGYHQLHDHYRTPINLKQVAARCGVSREHFIREFHARYSEAPGALLRRLRLEHARATLRFTTVSVEEVGLGSGFTSSNTFCRAYRQHFGRTPTAERSTPGPTSRPDRDAEQRPGAPQR